MNRLAYVSTMHSKPGGKSTSDQILTILNTSYSFNKNHGITGVLLIANTTIFEFLEGDNDILGQLFYRISRDKRHYDVSLIMNETNIETRLFTRWTMRLLSVGVKSHYSALEKIIQSCGNCFDLKSEKDKHRFDIIFPQDLLDQSYTTKVDIDKPKIDQPYTGVTLTLTKWPRPTDLKMTKELVDLCMRLRKNKETFNNLAQSGVYTTDEDLLKDLKKIDDLGLLKQEELKDTNSPKRIEHAEDHFSRALKKFLFIPIKVKKD